MPMILSANIGFITNSSSCVHHFPRRLLEDPEVKAFVEKFELQDGYIGDNLWHRGKCESIAITKEQKQAVEDALNKDDYKDYHPPAIDVGGDSIVIVYGDEYPGMAMTFKELLRQVSTKLGMGYGGGDEYN